MARETAAIEVFTFVLPFFTLSLLCINEFEHLTQCILVCQFSAQYLLQRAALISAESALTMNSVQHTNRVKHTKKFDEYGVINRK